MVCFNVFCSWDRLYTHSRCEYIFYRGLYRTSYARISRGTITDTETQIGQFVLPRHGEAVTNDTREARYLRSRKEDLAVDHVRSLFSGEQTAHCQWQWFPMEYYGDETKGGVNGHFYHVFNTVRCFNLDCLRDYQWHISAAVLQNSRSCYVVVLVMSACRTLVFLESLLVGWWMAAVRHVVE